MAIAGGYEILMNVPCGEGDSMGASVEILRGVGYCPVFTLSVAIDRALEIAADDYHCDDTDIELVGSREWYAEYGPTGETFTKHYYDEPGLAELPRF